MAGAKHTFRLGFLSPLRTFRITPDALEWTDRQDQRRIAFGDIEKIHSYKVRNFGVAGQTSALMWRCKVHARDGSTATLAQDHFVRIGLREDRGLSFRFFVSTLVAQASAANPRVSVSYDQVSRPGEKKGFSTQVVERCFNLLRRLNPDHTSALGGYVMRIVGPLLPEHRIGRDNLAKAFPDLTRPELDKTLRKVWENYGRVCSGILNLDRTLSFRLGEKNSDNLFLSEAALRLLEELRRDRTSYLLFTAHLANWEIPAPLARALGIDLVVPVRVQHLGPIAKLLADARPGGAETYIPVTSDAAYKLKSAIDRGASVAVMIDQHDADGIDVMFFGRTCKVNPAFARLARSIDWPIYGLRAIRLPDGRLCIDVTGPVERSRDSSGRVDIAATMQSFMSVVEQWVREHPDQWMWLHRLWRSK